MLENSNEIDITACHMSSFVSHSFFFVSPDGTNRQSYPRYTSKCQRYAYPYSDLEYDTSRHFLYSVRGLRLGGYKSCVRYANAGRFPDNNAQDVRSVVHVAWTDVSSTDLDAPDNQHRRHAIDQSGGLSRKLWSICYRVGTGRTGCQSGNDHVYSFKPNTGNLVFRRESIYDPGGGIGFV